MTNCEFDLVLEVIDAWHLNFNLGNAFRHTMLAKTKDDIQEALRYIKREMRAEEAGYSIRTEVQPTCDDPFWPDYMVKDVPEYKRQAVRCFGEGRGGKDARYTWLSALYHHVSSLGDYLASF